MQTRNGTSRTAGFDVGGTAQIGDQDHLRALMSGAGGQMASFAQNADSARSSLPMLLQPDAPVSRQSDAQSFQCPRIVEPMLQLLANEVILGRWRILFQSDSILILDSNHTLNAIIATLPCASAPFSKNKTNQYFIKTYQDCKPPTCVSHGMLMQNHVLQKKTYQDLSRLYQYLSRLQTTSMRFTLDVTPESRFAKQDPSILIKTLSRLIKTSNR